MNFNIFKRTTLMLTIVFGIGSLATTAQAEGPIPADKKAYISKMSCSELKKLLRNVREREVTNNSYYRDLIDDITFGERDIKDGKKNAAKLKIALKAEPDKNKAKLIKAKLNAQNKSIRNLQRALKSDNRDYAKLEKKSDSLDAEEKKVKRELKLNKCK